MDSSHDELNSERENKIRKIKQEKTRIQWQTLAYATVYSKIKPQNDRHKYNFITFQPSEIFPTDLDCHVTTEKEKKPLADSEVVTKAAHETTKKRSTYHTNETT